MDPDDGAEVERRFKAATAALEARLWREDLDLWDREFMPDSIQRNRALQGVALRDLDTDGLLEHLEAVRDNAVEMVWRHHKFTIPAVIPTGLYLSNAMQWTGMDAGLLLAPLKSSSPVSLGAKEELGRLAHAMTDAGLGAKDFAGESADETLDPPQGTGRRRGRGGAGLSRFDRFTACWRLRYF